MVARQDLISDAFKALDEAAVGQEELFSQEKISVRFLRAVNAGTTIGQFLIGALCDDPVKIGTVGVIRNGKLVLIPEVAYDAVERYLRMSGKSLAFSKDAL